MDVTIIHLSDLHFKNDVENRFRLSSLKTDLARLKADGPIYTVLTGDLTQAGDDGLYDALFNELLGPLISLGHDVFVVPGNHDVQRSVSDVDFSNRILSDRGSSYLYGAGSGIRSGHPTPKFDSLAKYRELEDLLGPYDQCNFWGYSVTRGPVSIVGLNSAWLCCERLDHQKDRGMLRVEPAALSSFVEGLPSDTLRVALVHHPLDWLEETTRSAVQDQLVQHFDLVLFGHLHASEVAGWTKGQANCLFHQAPPLRADWSKGTNGYAIVRANVEKRRFQIEYRSYSKTRRKFVTGEDFAAGGRLHPRSEDLEFYSASPSWPELLQRYADGVLFDYLDWYRNNVRAKSKLTGSFVVPKAKHMKAGEDTPWYGPPQAITEIVDKSSRSQFFVAPLDAGSTTAAYLTFKHLSETFALHTHVPAYFDAQREKINRASILREICRTSLVRYSLTEAEQLAQNGSIALVVDGLCLGDAGQFNLFRDTADRYFPKVRILYFLSTERHGIAPTGRVDINLSTAIDEVYELAQLAVADIRSMVALRLPELADNLQESIVNHVVESFQQMDEPIFASTVAVVIDTLKQDPEFKPINKARLIERYVECLLGRFDLEDVTEGTFASSDKINFLSFVAREMLIGENVGVSEGEWAKITEKYQIRYLMELPTKLLQEFIEKGLMTFENGKITFRGDHLFSFFVAQQMKTDPIFAAELITGEGLFRHYREVTVYGELEGTKVGDVLDAVYDVLGEIETMLLENYSREGIDLTEEWTFACLDTDGSAGHASLQQAAEDLGRVVPTRDAADRIDDAELAKIMRRRGIAERKTVREAEARLLVGMKLYGLLLRNALHIEAKDKLRHLKKLYEAAELWVGFMCSYRESVSRQPIFIVGGVRFVNLGAAVDVDRSVREFRFNAPNTISKLLASFLRNPQLAAAIRTVILTLDPMSALFAREALLEMPSTQNRKVYIDSLMKESDINLVTCGLRALRGKYLGAGRKKDRREHLEAIVEEIARDPRIASKIDFTQLRRARLVQDMRENAAPKNAK